MFRDLDEAQLISKAKQLRIDLLEMLNAAGSGHSGGSLSAMDLLMVLYNKIMKINPENPYDPDRDRFILSKGHVCPAHYVVLADCGYFDKSHLKTLRRYGSILQGHPHWELTPGLEVSSGSLGQGLSITVGMALIDQADKLGHRYYCMMGDGELQEGSIWEAAMAAGHYKLDNLCGIVDKNRLQIDGFVEDVLNIEPVADKWAAFGWNVIQIDGHDVVQIEDAYKAAAAHKGQPTVIIADTVKGKGVSFMEDVASWHGAAPNHEQLAAAIAEIEKA